MNDNNKKSNLPIHVILGASDYSKIKTATKPKIVQPLEPIAEHTTLGWTMMSLGYEPNLAHTYLTRTSGADYQELCNLDVLGLEDRPDGDQHVVYEEFAEQLTRNKDGRYQTSLFWKAGHSSLPTNDSGSLKRLDSLVKKLGRDSELLEKYDNIIQEQLAEGIVERVVETPKDREFYNPHKPVIKETAETTKVSGKWRRVIPIYKSGTHDNQENYRPISILPVLSKMLEREVHSQLYRHVDINNLLSPFQCGFCKNYSCETAVTYFTDKIRTNADCGLLTGAIFIDIKKAFDMVNHENLLRKLYRFGLEDTELDWFENYLTGRTQRVFIEGVLSNFGEITAGVPQGSILGPLLFVIYINDLPSVLSNSEILMYTDDTVIF